MAAHNCNIGMKVGALVFGPMQKKRWPGRILQTRQEQVVVKYFKIKDEFTVSLQSINLYT